MASPTLLANKTLTTGHGSITPSEHDSSRKMKAAAWNGKKTIEMEDRDIPVVTDGTDVIVQVTSTCICGSDLHLYLNAMPGMQKHDVMGHEFMGVVHDVGPEVKNLQKGDRVVAAFDIGCGNCVYCKDQQFSLCDTTNPSGLQEKLYGHRTAGLHGYSHLTGGYEGGQAEYARVPFADLNALKVPNDMPDRKVILLSDVLSTAWHATELGDVHEGDIVAIWGAGPVGILAAQCSFARGAKQVIMIDNVPFRLQFVKDKVPGVQTINFSEKSVKEGLNELCEHGPHVAIEAVGFHYCKSWTHKIQMALMLETDPSEMLNEILTCVRKGGRVSIVGVYAGFTNGFNIGALMEKGLTVKAGQTPCQKYWHHLLKLIQEGKLQPEVVITHEMDLDEAPKGYQIFNDKTDGCVKVVMHPRGAPVVA
jgi:threonine dehydrogenase-like Zn-dependent dehydrogenase